MSGSPLEQWKEGIAYNYEGSDLILSEEAGIETIFGNFRMLMILLLPPAFFAAAAAGRNLLRRRASDPEGMKARGALKRLYRSLGEIEQEKDISSEIFNGKIMDGYKLYLGDKLHISGAALTAEEVDRLLSERGVDIEVKQSVRKAMETCEHGAYAGGSNATGREELFGMIKRSAAGLDRIL